MNCAKVVVLFYAYVTFAMSIVICAASEQVTTTDCNKIRPSNQQNCFAISDAIMVDRNARTVTIAASVNQLYGFVEYILVHQTGKRHEAIFVTHAQPQTIQAAFLLIGLEAKPSANSLIESFINQNVSIKVTWKKHGPDAEISGDDLVKITNHDKEPLVTSTPIQQTWIYSGSYFQADGFAAEKSGSCIALQGDAAALMNRTLVSSQYFIPHAENLPSLGTPVSIIITLLPCKTASEEKQLYNKKKDVP